MSTKILRMTDLDLADKRVLIRLDVNVPVEDGHITSDARIRASLPTVEEAIEKGAKVILMSHLGRPEEGKVDDYYSLRPVAQRMQELLGKPVRLVEDYLDRVEFEGSEVILLENVRFNAGEKANDEALSKKLAALCDVFVNDAFATAHRAQASTHGVAQFAPTACAGPLMVAELDALAKALEAPKRPMVAIVGGSKVSTKLTVLESLTDKVDELILGGGIANTFIRAAGHEVGASLYEEDLVSVAKKLIEKMAARGAEISVPRDVVVGKKFSHTAEATIKAIDDVEPDEMILDLGPYAVQDLKNYIYDAGTIVWNGPLGVFEIDQFSDGTRALARAIAKTEAFVIAGGGDTLAAMDKFNIRDKVDYASTAGGAFLEFLEGKTLPAVDMLEQRAAA